MTYPKGQGLTVGVVSTKLKVNVLPTKSSNKAVETARTAARSEGRGLAAAEAKKIATKQTVKNQTVKNINKTLTDNTNKVAGSGASTIVKNKTDEKK